MGSMAEEVPGVCWFEVRPSRCSRFRRVQYGPPGSTGIVITLDLSDGYRVFPLVMCSGYTGSSSTGPKCQHGLKIFTCALVVPSDRHAYLTVVDITRVYLLPPVCSTVVYLVRVSWLCLCCLG